MTEATAQLNDYRQSPRKVRLVASALKGKKVVEAKQKLDFITKRATGPLHKLLNSAVANAKNIGMDASNLLVKSIRVDNGKILYRQMPAAHGSAHTIHKRTSHITIVLTEQKSEARSAKPETKKSKLKSKN